MMLKQRVGFIGAGQMARALSRGMVAAELLEPRQILVHDPVAETLQTLVEETVGIRAVADNPSLVEQADVVVLAVKPQSLDAVADQLSPPLSPDKLLVSIVAGVRLARLEALFGTRRIIRVMPNTPCLVGQGASAFALGAEAGGEDALLVGRLLDAVGVSVQLEEPLLDAVTGLSGSGPAFVYLMIEALSDGGVRMGLPRATATRLAAQTLAGAARMVLAGSEHPAQLKDRVASPGGTTIAGLQALEERGVRAALMAAVERATERARELGNVANNDVGQP